MPRACPWVSTKYMFEFAFTLGFILIAWFVFNFPVDDFRPTLMIALAALGISFYNLYKDSFRKIHDARCTLITGHYKDSKLYSAYTFENLGTESEIIVGAMFGFPGLNNNLRVMSFLGGTITKIASNTSNQETEEPFILKPKEIVVKEIVWDVPFEIIMRHLGKCKDDEFTASIIIQLSFIDPKRRALAHNTFNSMEIRHWAGKDTLFVEGHHNGQNEIFIDCRVYTIPFIEIPFEK